jgi:hypothetical protein
MNTGDGSVCCIIDEIIYILCVGLYHNTIKHHNIKDICLYIRDYAVELWIESAKLYLTGQNIFAKTQKYLIMGLTFHLVCGIIYSSWVTCICRKFSKRE